MGGNGRADFVDAVIEIGAGEAQRLGIGVGDPVRIESLEASGLEEP